MRAEFCEELVMRLEFISPGRAIDILQLSVLGRRELFEALPIQILEARHSAERCLHAIPVPLAALEHPLQYPHVFAEARPDELALGIATEPIDAEDARRVLDCAPHLQPMIEVVA